MKVCFIHGFFFFFLRIVCHGICCVFLWNRVIPNGVIAVKVMLSNPFFCWVSCGSVCGDVGLHKAAGSRNSSRAVAMTHGTSSTLIGEG